MAQYKYGNFLNKSNNAEFDRIHAPSIAAPWSGIYQCVGCQREATCVQSYQLPPQNHHQHTPQQGQIRWRLLVAHGTLPES